MSDWIEVKMLRAERDAANVELHRMHTEWLAARAERDAAQTALGLASEEVRALRAERGVKLDEDLERAIRESAERRGETVAQFVARACGERLHADTYAKG